MAFTVIIVFFVAGVNCVPHNNQNVNATVVPAMNNTILIADNSNLTMLPDNVLLNNTADALAMTNIITTFNSFQTNLRFDGPRRFFSVLMRTIDQQCMVDLYNQQNLSSMIPTQQLWNGENRTVIQGTFLATALLCSSKIDVGLEFVFESLRNLNVIARSFIDDPQLSDFAFGNMLVCANRFAFDNGVLDPEVYTLSSELRNEAEEDACLDWIDTAKTTFSGAKNFITDELSRTCTVRVVNQAEMFLVKLIVLSQAGLSPVRRRAELNSIIRDARQLLQKFLECAAKEPTKRRVGTLITAPFLRQF